MYRVVLIDDEPLITEGLRKIVSWEKYHCEVVGTAEDAVSGAELIRSLQPHIHHGRDQRARPGACPRQGNCHQEEQPQKRPFVNVGAL